MKVKYRLKKNRAQFPDTLWVEEDLLCAKGENEVRNAPTLYIALVLLLCNYCGKGAAL